MLCKYNTWEPIKYDLVYYKCRFLHSVIQKKIAWMLEPFLIALCHMLKKLGGWIRTAQKCEKWQVSSTDFLFGEDL